MIYFLVQLRFDQANLDKLIFLIWIEFKEHADIFWIQRNMK
jgi:hypothetical protein